MRFVPVKSLISRPPPIVLKTGPFWSPAHAVIKRAAWPPVGVRHHCAAGTTKVAGLISIVRDKTDLRLPKAARLALMEVASQIDALKAQIEKLDQAIVATVRRDDDARRLVTIPVSAPSSLLPSGRLSPIPAASSPAGTSRLGWA